MKTPTIEKNIDDWMTAYAMGELTPQEQHDFEAWLLVHPEARAVYEETQAMNRLLEKALKDEAPDPAFEDRMVVKFRRKVRKERGFLVWVLSLMQGPRAVLTGFAGVLLLSLYVGTEIDEKRSNDPESELVETARPIEIETKFLEYPEGKQRELEEYIADDRVSRNGFRADVELGEDKVAKIAAPESDWKTTTGDFKASAAKTTTEKSLREANDYAAGFRSAGNKPLSKETAPLPPSAPLLISPEKDGRRLNVGDSQLNEQPMPSTEALPTETEHSTRKLIRNAQAGLEVKNYAKAAEDISALSREQGGFIATQNDRTQANGRTAGQIVVKLPPDKLETFLLRLRDLGTIKNQTLKTDDVTKAYFDTEARLRNARRTEERLLELMSKKTDKVADLLQVEKEIGRVRESIEQMQGELKLWDSLASLATVTLDIVEQDLNRAAAYILKEEARLSLYAADVEKSYTNARRLADQSEAQILVSQINRETGGGITATLSLLVVPEKSFVLIEQLKSMGRVSSFTQDTQRIAQDGNPGAEAGTTRRDKVEVHLVIAHDDASRKTVSLQVVATEVEKALDASRKKALEAGGEILTSNLQRNPDGHASAVLQIRLPANQVETVRQAFSSQGRLVNLSVQRNDPAGTATENEDQSPVIMALTLSDEEPPVQVTRLSVQGQKVGERAENLKKQARERKVEVKSSSFVKSPDGREQASMVFRLLQRDYEPFLESLQSSGKILNLTLQREDRTGLTNNEEGTEPVEIAFTLVSPQQIVAENRGIWVSLRHTLGKSFSTLMKSVERIATGFAYLLPWILLAGTAWIVWKKYRKKKNRPE